MVAGNCDVEGAAPGTLNDHYLRTMHLDVSGLPLNTAQVKMLLLEAPFTLKQCFLLEGLVLEGCHLQPGAAAFVLAQVLPDWLVPLSPGRPVSADADVMQVLQSWRTMRTLAGVRRLVLARNPLLGCTLEQVDGLMSPAVQGRQSGFIKPAQLWWVQTRLLQAAPLVLLDMQDTGEAGSRADVCVAFRPGAGQATFTAMAVCHAGLSDAACGEVLRQLASYRLPANAGAPRPEAPTHSGCRTTLQCLRIGPPADCQHFSKETGRALACAFPSARPQGLAALAASTLLSGSAPSSCAGDLLVKVLETAAGLQVVQVAGLAPECAPPLQLAWQQVQERRGRSGYVAPGPAGTLRFALADG